MAKDESAILSERIDTLASDVAQLRMRLDELDRRLAADAAKKSDPDADYQRALRFSDELMRRFFGMVREMKREDSEDHT